MFYTLENKELKVVVSDLGATLVQLIDKGTKKDLVLGYDKEELYLQYNGANIGASVGRNANRIGNCEFKLNGKTYHLSENDHGNQLHGGGINGFAFKRWNVESKNNEEIVFSYFSKDLEEGFPGNLKAEVSYRLDNNNLIWSYSGLSDENTVFNMTNHSYFSLGEDTALDLRLQIFTDKYSPTDSNSLTLDKVNDVKGTPYDFTSLKTIRENVSQLKNGIDNNYVFENMNEKQMVRCESNDITMNVYSDLPDMHLYTAGYLNKEPGKYNRFYQPFDGVCFEAQFYPNGINYEKYIQPILKKNERKKHFIRYEIIAK